MSDETVFGWLYGYRLTRKPDVPIYLTCAGRTDGAGAQAQAVISTQAAARAIGIPYAHTPFRSMEHAPGEPAGWAARWEAILNLGDGEPQVASLGLQPVPLGNLIWEPERWNDRPLLIRVCHSHDFTDRWIDSYRLVMPVLRKRYTGVGMPPPGGSAGPDEVSVAVHVRRGDVDGWQDPARYTSNDRVLRVIRTIVHLLGGHGLRPRLTVYSEGMPEDFREFADCGCALHISEDALAAFHGLVCADVLVMAKSSFSYAAALLSDGMKVYEPFWHPPLAEWLALAGDEPIDGPRFMSLVKARLRRRETPCAFDPAAALALEDPPAAAFADVRLLASEAEALQNIEIGAYGDGLANSVPGYGRQCSLSWSVRLAPGTYDLFAEYATAESRPAHLLVDGYPVSTEAMAEPTGGWSEAHLRWSMLARIRLLSVARVISLRRHGAMPHIRQLRLSPA